MSNDPTTSSDLRQSEGDFQRLVESIEDYAIFMLDRQGLVLTWNSGGRHLFGYSADEIVGQQISRFYVEEDQTASKPERELETARAQGRIKDEGWRVRKDGSRFCASVSITLMRDAQGDPIGFAMAVYDLTEHNETAQKLRSNEEEFRRLVEGVEEYAIYMLDPTGNVATWNSGAEKIKQYRASEIIGKHFSCFYTAEDVAAGVPQRNLAETRMKGHIRAQGLRIRKDGSTFHAEVVLTALRDESRQLSGFSKVTRDITDQVRSRELEAEKMAAVQANKAKDDFLAALSHELRTPLTPALAAASYLADNTSKFPSEFSEDVDTIRRNVQLQARLIDDLLDLTRVTRGKIDLHFERVDAHALLREALEIAKTGIGDKALKISTDLQAANHHIWADSVRIQQVFWNVINNAVKFTGAGGRITIRTANDEHDHFEFEVTDTGIGIETQRQPSLFKAFEQGERGITRQFGGLGIGLAISKNLIDLHHGVITVESRGRSFGATFKVILDVVKSTVGESGVEAQVPDRSTKRLRILLVEDHDDTRRVLSRLLSHFGHDISVADSTRAAMEIVESKEFDVILSDIGLPDGSGYDIISEAKRKKPVKGVALTGFGTDEDIQRSKEAGFDFHLTKPVDVHELRSVLTKVGA